MDRPDLLVVARERVVVLDGAMGTAIHQADLSMSDYRGCENCSEVIVLSRPDIVLDIHRSFLAVGCDAVLTNTFGASKLLLSEFGLAEQAWVVGHRFRYPHLGAKEEFIVAELIREGGRFRANVLIVETEESGCLT